MSQRYQSEEFSENDSLAFTEKLYSQNEKYATRYQSQEFMPYNPEANNVVVREPSPYDKPLIKHHSYDDKTLSKSQIREYKSQKLRQSQSFHEHLLTGDIHKIDEEKLDGSSTTTTSTGTDNSSPMFPRPEKLIRCSPYYSSSLSSESPPIQKTTTKIFYVTSNRTKKSTKW